MLTQFTTTTTTTTTTMALAAVLATSPVLISGFQFDPLQHLAGIAPYFDSETPPKSPSPPQGCNVTRAAYLVRHAAIYANDFDYETYIEPFTDKLGNITVSWSSTSSLQFLANWTTPIEDDDIEELTRVGKTEALNLGQNISSRYPTFAPEAKIWYSDAERTTLSAESFAKGLGISTNSSNFLSVYEGEEAGADTLTPHDSCPAFSSSAGSDQSGTYQELYTKPIIDRFNAQASAFNFTADDIYGMQQLCGYETVIRGSSPFCKLFSPDEWLSFEYTNDIMYHYELGYGSDLSPYLGMPWVNATASMLLNDSSTTEPLVVSFTHREEPPFILTALDLFNGSTFTGANKPNASFPLTQINHNRAWRSSNFIPFLGNIAIERLECDSYGFDEQATYFRVLVNSSPQPIISCASGPAESCPAEDFRSFVEARSSMYGNFSEACEVDYKNSTDIFSLYSQ